MESGTLIPCRAVAWLNCSSGPTQDDRPMPRGPPTSLAGLQTSRCPCSRLPHLIGSQQCQGRQPHVQYQAPGAHVSQLCPSSWQSAVTGAISPVPTPCQALPPMSLRSQTIFASRMREQTQSRRMNKQPVCCVTTRNSTSTLAYLMHV